MLGMSGAGCYEEAAATNRRYGRLPIEPLGLGRRLPCECQNHCRAMSHASDTLNRNWPPFLKLANANTLV